MHNYQRESFVVRVIENGSTSSNTTTSSADQTRQYYYLSPKPRNSTVSSPHLNLSAMKLFNRFRKLLMRLILSIPAGRSSSSATPGMTPRHRNGDVRFDPPKTSCSSYYSSHSHYNEAIADCIEFFNKSSQEGINMDARKSDVMV